MNMQETNNDEMWRNAERFHRRGKIISGLLIILIGGLFLAKELGAELPDWLLSWKMLLIGVGLMIGIKHKFRNVSWLILIGIGGTFLLSDLYPEMHLKPVLWPVLLILVGLLMVFRPRKRYCGPHPYARRHWRHRHASSRDYAAAYYNEQESSNEDVIDSTCFMSGVKKNILSKNFKGGEVSNIFGGTELNLMQADFEGTARLEITQVFGGTKLLVPSNWEIKSELVTVFGSMEDKRPLPAGTSEEKNKILVLTGTTFFGGIDIRSY